jgi:hypothetical protein
VIGPEEKEIVQAKILSESYKVQDIGVAKYFLGAEIHQDDDGSMSLSQTSYINKLCDRYKMVYAKPVINPTEMGQLSKLRSGEPSTAAESIDMTKVPYRELIGGLLFISTRTRPDIVVAVGIVARRVFDPRQVDWIAAKRILRYLEGTGSYQLRFPAEGEVELSTYGEADYAASADRKSICVFWRMPVRRTGRSISKLAKDRAQGRGCSSLSEL